MGLDSAQALLAQGDKSVNVLARHHGHVRLTGGRACIAEPNVATQNGTKYVTAICTTVVVLNVPERIAS